MKLYLMLMLFLAALVSCNTNTSGPNAASAPTAVDTLQANKDTLVTQVRALYKAAKQLQATKQTFEERILRDSFLLSKRPLLHTVKFRVIQDAIQCDSSATASRNTIVFDLPVDWHFYDKCSVGQVIAADMDLGQGFTFSGELEGWSIIIVDKKILTKND